MKNFKQLQIWQKGLNIAVKSHKLTSGFSKELKYSLGMQINKAATSIPSNVAEGSSRSSEKDYSRYIEIALGSCFGLETQIMIAQAINSGNQSLIGELLIGIDEEQKMLMSFKSKLIT